MRKIVIVIATAAATLALASPAQAMGSGNPYDDLQGGVTYTVYSPTFTAGLNVRSVGGNAATAPGIEENLVASFGKRNGRNVTIYEGNPLGSDPGYGKLVMTATVQGAKASVYAFCDPATPSAWRSCSPASVSKVGGYLLVTLPAAKGLRPTSVQLETDGPKALSAQQLVQIARGMQPITS